MILLNASSETTISVLFEMRDQFYLSVMIILSQYLVDYLFLPPGTTSFEAFIPIVDPQDYIKDPYTYLNWIEVFSQDSELEKTT